MTKNKAILEGTHFLTGNEAAAEGAIAAGCRFFAGYPITPSTELAERSSRRLPQVGGIFVQMEDELASMAAIVGASWGGAKSMTSTSGPGFSLMMENLGLGVMMETPCVVVNVQRAGPSTGLPTYVGQGEVMQAKWGSHGQYEIIALSPSSPQECFDLMIKAFNFSERYRTPVIVLMDECTSHMSERVVIPPGEEIEIENRPRPSEPPDAGRHYPYRLEQPETLVPPMALAGEGYNIHTTGLTHDERGYPVMNAEAQEILVKRLNDKILTKVEEITLAELANIEDAEIIVVAFGTVARTARRAVSLARKEGKKVGLLRMITIWPFPDFLFDKIIRQSKDLKAFVVAEINYGQIVREVQRVTQGRAKVHLVPKMGGELHTPDEIRNGIEEVM